MCSLLIRAHSVTQPLFLHFSTAYIQNTFSGFNTTQTAPPRPLVESWRIQSCNSVSAVTRQSELCFHLTAVVWHQGLAPAAKHKFLRRRIFGEVNFSASNWLTASHSLPFSPPCFLWDRKSALLPVTGLFHVVTSLCFASGGCTLWTVDGGAGYINIRTSQCTRAFHSY